MIRRNKQEFKKDITSISFVKDENVNLIKALIFIL